MRKILTKLFIVGSISLLYGQPAPFIPDTNTVGLWHLNEGSGLTAYDTSGNGLDGTLENGVSWTPNGMFGSCLQFNAEYQRVWVADTSILDIPTELTIEAWIKLDTTNDGGTIVNKWHTNTSNPKGQYRLGISSANKLFCYFGNDTSQFNLSSDTILIAFNEWKLVSAVFSNGQAGLFINGEQIAASPVPFDSLTMLEYPHDDLFIGDLWTDQWYPYSFDGEIDEVRISNCARYQIITDVEDHRDILPRKSILEQNYPNPFNPGTTIAFDLPLASHITLQIYDVLGREVKTLVDERKPAGRYTVQWDGTNHAGKPVTSGVYLYHLQAGQFEQTRKMLLVR